ncbi:hypothetical protein BpHYR1_012015 [Brachionus plicatilis]|uniref:Uncharacterized protein n=1 Tax=Brachionus plicatilis TaxID=10195 RepID=A0A3M7SIZ2_BRAPC|nr:hypothetical protein BpHYR1_012015 [Brachionus plicatilis]
MTINLNFYIFWSKSDNLIEPTLKKENFLNRDVRIIYFDGISLNFSNLKNIKIFLVKIVRQRRIFV